MEPVTPMQNMKSMTPINPPAPWWPERFGQASCSGGQNQMRYAFFPEKFILLVELAGALTIYDSGDHQVGSIAQKHGDDRTMTFTSQHGVVDLNSLKQLAEPACR